MDLYLGIYVGLFLHEHIKRIKYINDNSAVFTVSKYVLSMYYVLGTEDIAEKKIDFKHLCFFV